MQFAATANNSSDTHKQKGKKKSQLFQQNARKDLDTIAYTSLCRIWALVTFFSFCPYPEPRMLVGISLKRRRPLQKSPEFHYILKVHS